MINRNCFLPGAALVIFPVFLSLNAAESNDLASAANAADQAALAARETTLALDIVMRAIENATATRNQAEKNFLLSLKDHESRDEINDAEDVVEESAEDLEDAFELAVKMAHYTSSANKAALAAQTAVDKGSKEKAKAIKKETMRLLKTARKEAEKASRIRTAVKDRWLLPELNSDL